MATKRELSDYTVIFSVLGHRKFIHKILAKSESVRFQPLFKFFGALRELLLKPQNAGLVNVKKDLNSKRSKGIFVHKNLKNKHSY